MKQELAIKVYEVDYSFIIKNYLDPQLWQKEWTLFVYKDMVFSIRLSSIYTRSKKLYFDVIARYSDGDSVEYVDTSIGHDLGNSNINVLKRQIKGAMESLISSIEQRFTRKTKEYKMARDLETQHRENLEEKANSFLDENGIYIDDVRDAYVDWYLNKMDYNYANNVINSYNHDLLFDVYLVFYKATEQKDKFEWLKENYLRKHDDKSDLLKEIEEKIAEMETDEYQEELEDGLESIM